MPPTGHTDLSLDAQHAAFLDSRFLAGVAIGVGAALAPLATAVWTAPSDGRRCPAKTSVMASHHT